MDGLLAFVVLVVPILLAYVLRTTRAWWAPPLIPWIGAGVLYSMQDHDHPGDVGGIGAFGNGVLVMCAIGLALFGAILLAITGMTRRNNGH